MRAARCPALRWITVASLVALCVAGAPAAAQQPAPTPLATPAPTAALPTPTVAPPTLTAAPVTPTAAPTLTAAPVTPTVAPVMTPTSVPTFWDLVIGLLLILWQSWGWPAVAVAGVLMMIIFVLWKPVVERVQDQIKALLKRMQEACEALKNREKKQKELEKFTKVYCERLCRELALTEVIPIPNAHAMTDTRNYAPLRVARPGTTTGEAVFAAFDAKSPPRGLLLVGVAGSGKSHTLRYTAFVLAESWPRLPQRDAEPLGLRADASLLPIYVRLQDLPRCRQKLRERKGGEPTLLEMIDYHVHHRPTADGASLIEDFVSSHVAADNERCLFLFDGLDEIDDARQRTEVQEQIIRLQCEKPTHWYVVTSRPLVDQTLAGAGFAERRLLLLQPDQMERILFYWYRAECGPSPTADDEARARRQATSLLTTLRNDPDLEPMTVNPLFLTAMARMATTSVGLPAARVQKYHRMTDLLLEWRRNRMCVNEKEDLFSVDPRAALGELGRFAACMLLTGQAALSIDAYVTGACVGRLPPRSDDSPAYGVSDLERLFRSIARHTGLLSEDEEADRYRFSFAFRDYFAARFFAFWHDVARRFRERGCEPDWHTPIVLTAGY